MGGPKPNPNSDWRKLKTTECFQNEKVFKLISLLWCIIWDYGAQRRNKYSGTNITLVFRNSFKHVFNGDCVISIQCILSFLLSVTESKLVTESLINSRLVQWKLQRVTLFCFVFNCWQMSGLMWLWQTVFTHIRESHKSWTVGFQFLKPFLKSLHPI